MLLASTLAKQGDIYMSICLTICALIVLTTVSTVYLTKKRFHGFESQLYRITFIISIILNVVELAMCLFSHYIGLNTIPSLSCGYLYMLFIFIYLLVLFEYLIIANSKNKKRYEEMSIAKKRWLTLASIGIGVILMAISTIFRIRIEVNVSKVYIVGVSTLKMLYFVIPAFICVVAYIITKGDKTSLLNYLKKYGFVLLALLTLSLLLVKLYGVDVNDISFIIAIIELSIYFNSECQDYKMIKDLQISKDAAEKASNAQTDFLSNISHEIRTPMNSILGFSESLLRRDKINKSEVEKDLNGINVAGETLLELINNVLDISRIESGKEHLEAKDYSVTDLIFEVTSVITPRINKENIEYKVIANENLPKELTGDGSKINRIINNTLKNAIKQTNYGEIEVSYKNENTPNGCIFIIEITSTGSKMTREMFDVEFNDFVKIGDGSTNTIDSIGLGLIIAKRYANMMGGVIDFRTKDETSIYTIKLEQKIKNAEPIGNIFEIKDEMSQTKDLTGKKALIVDDNSINIKLATMMLQKYNLEIDSATSGKECIKMAKENKYDIIFLDHMMPEMDGIQTMRVLTQENPDICPTIALTANNDVGIRNEYINNGFTEYLSKPINARELNRIINIIFSNIENK